MSAATKADKKVWTEAELQALPEKGLRHEVIDGQLTMSPKNNFYHGAIGSRLLAALVHFNQSQRLGAVLDSSTGFWMNNRNCRAPDISFVAKARLEAAGFNRRTNRFFPGAPDLAIEILSPNNSPAEMQSRLADYFASGTQVVWMIHPEEENVEVCHSPQDRAWIRSGGFLEGGLLLPGFHYPIADLFKEWDWD